MYRDLGERVLRERYRGINIEIGERGREGERERERARVTGIYLRKSQGGRF